MPIEKEKKWSLISFVRKIDLVVKSSAQLDYLSN